MRIRLDYPASEAVLRQTPGRAGVWDGVRFVERDTAIGPFDGWVVFERLPAEASARCDPGRTVFVAGEPPTVRPYHPRFLRQFAAVIAPGHDLDHPGFVPSHSAIPWWVGMVLGHQPDKTVSSCLLDYDHLKAAGLPEKRRAISVLCSDKATTDGHRQRLQFVRRLRDHFGDRLDVFGHGFWPVADKWDAIAPYRYHVVIENSRHPHYWTEKLADAFLGGAYPIYCGCPNLADYFPPSSFCPIDRGDPDGTIATIERVMAIDPYERVRPAVAAARDLVLDRHNLFPMLAALVRRLPSGNKRRPVTVRPECDFTDHFMARTKRRLKRGLARASRRWQKG